MSQLSPAMDAALGERVVTIFGAIEIVLPDHTIRLLDSAGVVTFGGKTFTGRDPVYGALYSIDALSDGTGDTAPALKVTFTPATDAAATTLASAGMQGSRVTMWLGVDDPATGQAVGEPYVVFAGVLDTVTLKSGANSRSLEIVVSSIFEDFFYNDDGARLNDTFHKFVWPGERGMAFVTYITHQLYWGSDSPSGVTT